MVHVYMADTEYLPDPKEVPSVMRVIPKLREEKILRCRQAEGRKERLGTALLLKEVLRRFGHCVEGVHLNENGKPELEGGFFNLSHSHGKVVCAYSNAAVGCDIEKIGTFREAVARRVCTKKELEYLQQWSGQKRERECYRLWTMKESYVKMTGEGIRFPLNRVEFVFGDGNHPVEVYRNGEKEECRLKEYEAGEYQVTVCGKEAEFAPLEVVAFPQFF